MIEKANVRTKAMHKFDGMRYVQDKYENLGLTDTSFANLMSNELAEPYSMAEVRQYRQQLGIPVTGSAVAKPRSVWVVMCSGLVLGVFGSGKAAAALADTDDDYTVSVHEII